MDNKTKGVLEYRFPLPPFILELGRQRVPLSWDKINERATLLFPKISHNCEMWGKGGRGELGETVLSLFCPSTVVAIRQSRVHSIIFEAAIQSVASAASTKGIWRP